MSEDDSRNDTPESTERSADKPRRSWLDRISSALSGEPTTREDLVELLREESRHRPTALVYVSDHGESTGESGLYLHGAPYALAPDEQTRVPMIVWTSPAFRAWRGLDAACVMARRDHPLSHDHFFHTVLGLLDVRTASRVRRG